MAIQLQENQLREQTVGGGGMLINLFQTRKEALGCVDFDLLKLNYCNPRSVNIKR